MFYLLGLVCMSMSAVGAARLGRFGVGFVWLVSACISTSISSATGIAIVRFSSCFVWSRDAVLRVGECYACPLRL